eukprot:UN31898
MLTEKYYNLLRGRDYKMKKRHSMELNVKPKNTQKTKLNKTINLTHTPKYPPPPGLTLHEMKHQDYEN